MLFNYFTIQQQLGLIYLLAILKSISGLRCYECLALSCDSPIICESIRISMQDPAFYPKSMHIEFKPNTICPTFPINNNNNGNISSSSNNSLSAWTNLSHECPIEDSACLEATIEIISTFNGLNNSLELEPHSTMTSFGYIRACASRRFLKSREEPTISYKDDCIDNDTLSDIVTRAQKRKGETIGSYVVQMIHSHEFYIDHGTMDAVTCYQDNCNSNMRAYGSRSGAGARGIRESVGNVRFLIAIILLTMILHPIKNLDFV